MTEFIVWGRDWPGEGRVQANTWVWTRSNRKQVKLSLLNSIEEIVNNEGESGVLLGFTSSSYIALRIPYDEFIEQLPQLIEDERESERSQYNMQYPEPPIVDF